MAERSSCGVAADEPNASRLGETIPARFGSEEQGFFHQQTDHPVAGSGSNEDVADGAHETEFCGTYWLLRRLGNRWTIPILSALRQGPVRFAKLKRALNSVSQRMLTLTLRRLEHDGLIYREEIPGQTPQVRYSLAPLGVALVERLDDFERWLAAQGQIPHPPKN